MDLTLTFYLSSVVAILLTGISKSGFGGGLGVMAVPIMSLFVAPQFAAAVMMPILLAMDVLIVWRYRNHWDRRIVIALLVPALVGIAIGALTFEYMRSDLVRLVVGLLALFFIAQFVLSQVRRQDIAAKTPAPVVWALGATSGFASYIAHAGGPPVKGYLLRQHMDKTVFVGTNTVYFFLINAIKTVAYGSTGAMNANSLWVSLTLAPVLFVGIFVGTRLHNLVDQAVFVKIVYGFLALTAAKLLYDSIPMLLGAS